MIVLPFMDLMSKIKNSTPKSDTEIKQIFEACVLCKMSNMNNMNIATANNITRTKQMPARAL